MGPKRSKKEKSQVKLVSISETTTDDGKGLTGIFEVDFGELCRERHFSYIPPVVLRAKPPVPPTEPEEEPVTLPSPSRKVASILRVPLNDEHPKRRHTLLNSHDDTEAEKSMEVFSTTRLSSPYSTTNPKPHTSFRGDSLRHLMSLAENAPDKASQHNAMPTIQVDQESPERPETVTAIYIRGWKVDMSFLEVFEQCWPAVEHLSTINFWRVGLTRQTLEYLANILPRCLRLKELCLDNNAVPEQNYQLLIEVESNVQHLSLRHCSIDNEGAKKIGLAISACNSRAKDASAQCKLVSLNLNGNYIGDEGAAYLAKALRRNRNLLSLSLTNNKIGDIGASKLAEVLQVFPLTHEEIVENRKLMSTTCPSIATSSPRQSITSREPSLPSERKKLGKHKSKDDQDKGKDKKERPVGKEPTASRSGGKTNASVKDTSQKDVVPVPGKGKENKEEPAGKDKGKDGQATDGKREPKAKAKRSSNLNESSRVSAGVTKRRVPEISVKAEPEAFLKGDQWCFRGNRTLINLSLAHNQIGQVGLTELLAAARYQAGYKDISTAGEGKGLLRLYVDRNLVSSDNDILKRIKETMYSRDPYLKSAAELEAKELPPLTFTDRP